MPKREISEMIEQDLQKPTKFSKRSLDSDEEDYDEDSRFRLREADIEGQEPTTLEYDEEIKITPFNMKEELEDDGYFDGGGNFIFNKTRDVGDNWLEEVDWTEVRRRQTKSALKSTAISDSNDDSKMEKSDKLDSYRQILTFLHPNESVLKAIKRMGSCSNPSKSASASERWSKKRQDNKQTSSGDPEGLIRLTELADRLLQAGDFDVYEQTYGSVKKLIEVTEMCSQEDELDAIGEAIDKQDPAGESEGKEQCETNEEATIQWHLKRSPSNDAPIEGPYSTADLKDMQRDKFTDAANVFVREVSKPDGQFYSLRRIDLDLYE